MSNSKAIDHTFIEGSEKDNTNPPRMGYFDTYKTNTENSASTLKSLLKGNCNIKSSDLLTPDNPNKYYEDTIRGTIDETCGISSVDVRTSSIDGDVSNNCGTNNGQKKISNTIKYLLCQLAFSRNRTYDSSEFDVFNSAVSVKDIFDKFTNIKTVMLLIFLLSIYFLIQGFFSSWDVGSNMMNLIEENSSKNLVYYISLGFGVAVPVLILCLYFVREVCGSLESTEEYNITDDIHGIKETINSGFKSLDYTVLGIFLFLIYGLVVGLFVTNKTATGPTMYIIIVSSILFIISIFMYLFYNFIPFFATANINNYGKEDLDLKLYVDENGTKNPGQIKSNQLLVQNLQKVFFKTAIVIFVFFMIYIFGSKKLKDTKGTGKDIFSGFFGASAILILPIVWVFNFILATKYFYIYPIVLLGFRFLRYIGMAILYGQYIYAQEYGIEGLLAGDFYSDDLKEQLEDFSNYSPSYNLVGVDIIKTCLNIFGYENIFSKQYTDPNKPNNLGSNRYVIPGIFSYLGKDKNANEDVTMSKLYIQGFIGLLTIIVTFILLKSVYKVY